jgi:hypothetical protein
VLTPALLLRTERGHQARGDRGFPEWDDIQERWEVEADFRILPTMETPLEVATLSNWGKGDGYPSPWNRALVGLSDPWLVEGGPIAIGSPKLLPDAASEAQSL